MYERSQYHLILDRAEPQRPRWVIAKEYATIAAAVPDDVDGHPRPTRWLGEFSDREFEWMRYVFGRESALRIPSRGEVSYTTRISHHHSPWTEFHVPVIPDNCTCGHNNRHDDRDGHDA